MTYDMVVIGGGPAGCAAAITAKRAGRNVLLLERGKLPRQRVCGEFVSSEALRLLRDLLDNSQILDRAVAIPSARIFMDEKIVEAAISPAANSIPRFEMDWVLWQAATDLGVDCCQQYIVQRIEGEGPFTLHANDQSFAVRSVVNASGRWSNLRNAMSPQVSGPKWIGIKAHYAESQPAQSVDLYFFQGGYCGVQPVSESEVNVCAMVRSDIASSLEQVIACEPNLLKRSAGWKLASEPVSTSPLIFREPTPTEGNIILAGDAAAFIDPFVGDGISMALHSGSMAAQALESFLSDASTLEDAAEHYGRQYQQKLVPAFRNAERARRMISAPRLLRRAALSMMSVVGLTETLVNKTRARIV
ncbi:MAG: dependent oxidoreductase [Acidobacteriales bacterium]|nr:dependent oxidoreductase [Terriglobales bacterium]